MSARSFCAGAKPLCSHLVEQLQQPIERVLVAGEQNLLFVFEVVVEIALLHAERGRDGFDGRAVIAQPPEGLRRAFEDVDAGRGGCVGVSGTRGRGGAARVGVAGPTQWIRLSSFVLLP